MNNGVAVNAPAPPTRGVSMASGLVRPPLSAGVRLLYGLGSAATGGINRSLNAFLLLFYSQVLGLPAAMAASVIMVVTIFDAVVDPIVGRFSDNLRSRWGRRHPLMYAAALPTSLAFFMLWRPPAGLAEAQLAAYLLACLLLIRFTDTLFELPSLSLAPELTQRYDERSILIAIRKGFEIIGGYLFVIAGYQVFMREGSGGGLTSPEGYAAFGVFGGLFVLTVIIASTLGTRRFIPWLSGPSAGHDSIRSSLGEVRRTLLNAPFLVMAATGMLYSTAVGITQALSIYFNLFFWELSQSQVALITTAQVPASLFAVFVAPIAVRAFGKKAATQVSTILGLLLVIAPVSLRLLGVLPTNGHPLIFPLLAVEAAVSHVFLVVGVVLIPSMLADVVEDVQVRTGRRSEGLIFAAESVARKAVSGVGVFIAGIVLTVVDFPRKAHPGTVGVEHLRDLGLLWVCATVFFLTSAMVVVAFFPIDRRRHEDNLARIAATEEK